jgi:hypothetical protein
MPAGYLENNYLEDLSDELGADLDASGATVALTPAPGEVTAPPVDVVRIGSLVIKRSTLYLTIVVVLLIALYLHSTKKKRRADA